MKITLTFKMPDVLDQLNLIDIMEHYNLESTEETENIVSQTVNKFISYNEYIYIEFNLETGEARVMEK